MRGRGTIKCYDCGAQVQELKEHRVVCPNSRKAKSSLDKLVHKRGQHAHQDGKTVFILLDVSGSMDGARLAAAKIALNDCFDSMEYTDRFAIITFDSSAFFKLKPRPVEQLRRQNELPGILDRIFARGSTALYDAIYIAIEQIHDKTNHNVITVLTDGEDNASKHTLAEVLALLSEFPNISLDIVHIDGQARLPAYESLVAGGRGQYVIAQTVETIVKTTTTLFTDSYKK
jgi:Ca-activated chloride channel family protein